MAISITNLSGGNTPADGSDPRTFPAIWNATATDLEGVATDLDTLEATVGAHDLNSLSGVGITTPVEGDLLTYNGTSWVNGVPAGSVLQVVSTTKSDTFSASVAQGAEIAVTGLTATITPSAVSSKIWVMATVSLGNTLSNAEAQFFTLFRDSTAIGRGDAAGDRQRVTASSPELTGPNELISVAGNTFDSPSSTSAITYSVKASHGRGATTTLYVNRTAGDDNSSITPRGISTITLMEVAG